MDEFYYYILTFVFFLSFQTFYYKNIVLFIQWIRIMIMIRFVYFNIYYRGQIDARNRTPPFWKATPPSLWFNPCTTLSLEGSLVFSHVRSPLYSKKKAAVNSSRCHNTAILPCINLLLYWLKFGSIPDLASMSFERQD